MDMLIYISMYYLRIVFEYQPPFYVKKGLEPCGDVFGWCWWKIVEKQHLHRQENFSTGCFERKPRRRFLEAKRREA